eukprot:946827_1
MGQSLSFLTTLSLFSATIHAHCINDEDYVMPPGPEGEKHDCSSLTPQDCRDTPGCKWNGPDPDTIHLKSLTMPTVEDGRLKKPLAPIDAITEYIGDYVYYEQLRKQLPTIYTPILKDLTKDKLEIASLSTPIASVLTDNPDDPIPLLQYSRPYFPPELLKSFPVVKHLQIMPFISGGFPIEHFTLSNVVAIAYIAWWDALTMDDDRFQLTTRVISNRNDGNMMVHPEAGAGGKHDDIVPIDQSFARALTSYWFDYPKEESDKGRVKFSLKGRKLTDPKTPDTQLEKSSEDWQYWYERWVKKHDKALSFVKLNEASFPVLIYFDETFKKKIAAIIDIIWTAKGRELCKDMGESIAEVFEQIDANKPDIHSLLKDTGMWESTHRGVQLVKTVINKQIKACEESANDLSELVKGEERNAQIMDTLKTNPHILIKRFKFESKPPEAKQLQHDDVLYLDIDSKEVGQANDAQFGDEHYASSHAQSFIHSDKYYWNGFV